LQDDRSPSPSADRLISCALVVGVVCLTLAILAMIAYSVGTG
jgi:hypothetical protein